MRATRFSSGDSHVHFLSADGAHLESSGEDLNIVNLLQSQWGSLFTNAEDFTDRASMTISPIFRGSSLKRRNAIISRMR